MPTIPNSHTLSEADLPLIADLPGDLPQMAGVIAGIIKNDVIAVQIVAALSSQFRGMNVYFPNMEKFMRGTRDRRIREDFDAGLTGHRIAMKYGLSERHIWHILGQAE